MTFTELVRVTDEVDTLDEKIAKLDAFIIGPSAYHTLEPQDRDLLVRQLAAMREYSGILHQRIVRANSE